LTLGLVLGALFATASEARKPAGEVRAKIDRQAEEGLERLFEEKGSARELYDAAYGYAVFSKLKVAVVVSGGHGKGVAVRKETGDRTYMQVGTGGVGFGLGGQKSYLVMLFESADAFNNFLDKGWQADGSAQAAAGTDGANANTTFRDGVAIFNLTKKGLVASADITGTKFWIDEDLN
jgi:lipid-binding SYLF domain-containing protein